MTDLHGVEQPTQLMDEVGALADARAAVDEGEQRRAVVGQGLEVQRLLEGRTVGRDARLRLGRLGVGLVGLGGRGAAIALAHHVGVTHAVDRGEEGGTGAVLHGGVQQGMR